MNRQCSGVGGARDSTVPPLAHSALIALSKTGGLEERSQSLPAWTQPRAGGFTLIELLVSITIVAILATLSIEGLGQMRSIAQGAYCANSLRQLGIATSLYLSEHQQKMFAYCQVLPTGHLWYFGFETSASLGSAEGDRTIDVTQAPIYPYVRQVGGVEVCPSFPYNQAIWKPKYSGASWGYGFNTFLSNASVLNVQHPAQIILFGDCAQVNTFEAPASAKHPMLEEFYMIENQYKTIHFRHGGSANMLFLDGHVEKFTMYPGTLDTTLPSVNVGRITPVGSTQYLR
jgi:prepilin-type processing-associated H-X9-DG protein/prepilin-type N-terminal cleavage/methylation domain-containing protein